MTNNLYKIDFKAIEDADSQYVFLLDNDFFLNLIDSDIISSGEVKATALVKKSSYSFSLKFQLEGIIEIPCDRCLDNMKLNISSTFDIIAKFGEVEGEIDDILIIPELSGILDISWLLYENIILQIPIKHTHPEGECNILMMERLKSLEGLANSDEELNDEDMDSPNKEIDPRWNDLKKIIDNN